ncbi:hypothetical protein GOB57_09625 [Sinorhizobium meliloti]|nr:hypothetical protein [Sinorhizobium meliloti]
MRPSGILVEDVAFERFDTAVTSLILLHDAAKDIKRLTKSKAAYVDGDDVYTSGYTDGSLPDEALFERIRAQYPGVTILNTMTLEASAVELVKAQRRKYEADLAADPLPGVPRV